MQKDSLQQGLDRFLAALSGDVTLATPIHRDLCRFLTYMKQRGKTQGHLSGGHFLGQRGQHSCGWRVRLSYKTVDSYMRKCRSIFHAQGRDGESDKRLGL